MEIAVIRFIILGVISGLTKGAAVLPAGPLNAAVGGTVMFTTTLTPTEKPFVSISWSVNGTPIIVSNVENITEPEYEGRITLFISTGSLQLRNLALSDSGEYGVTIIPQGVQQMTGSIRLKVLNGPENVKLIISPPQEHHDEGSDIDLSCSADSRPAALFSWFLNGDKLSDTGPELRLMNIQMSQSGNYSCQTFNEKTLRYETSQSSVVSVLEKISGKTSCCSAGCIAGIVIACLVVCGAAAGGGVYYIYRKKPIIDNKAPTHPTTNEEKEGHVYEMPSVVYENT